MLLHRLFCVGFLLVFAASMAFAYVPAPQIELAEGGGGSTSGGGAGRDDPTPTPTTTGGGGSTEGGGAGRGDFDFDCPITTQTKVSEVFPFECPLFPGRYFVMPRFSKYLEDKYWDEGKRRVMIALWDRSLDNNGWDVEYVALVFADSQQMPKIVEHFGTGFRLEWPESYYFCVDLRHQNSQYAQYDSSYFSSVNPTYFTNFDQYCNEFAGYEGVVTKSNTYKVLSYNFPAMTIESTSHPISVTVGGRGTANSLTDFYTFVLARMAQLGKEVEVDAEGRYIGTGSLGQFDPTPPPPTESPDPGGDPEPDKGIWEKLGDILKAVVGVPGSILSGLGDIIIDAVKTALTSVLLPPEGWLEDQIDGLKIALGERLDITSYQQALESFQSASAAPLPDFTFRIMGVEASILDTEILNQYKEVWFDWIRGITFVLLLIFNINQVYKLIRGQNLVDGGGDS